MPSVIKTGLKYADMADLLSDYGVGVTALDNKLSDMISPELSGVITGYQNEVIRIYQNDAKSDESQKANIFTDIPRIQFLSKANDGNSNALEQMLYEYTLSKGKPGFLQGKFEGRFFEAFFDTCINLIIAQNQGKSQIETLAKTRLSYSYINENGQLNAVTLYYTPAADTEALDEDKTQIKLDGLTLVHVENCLSQDARLSIFEHSLPGKRPTIDSQGQLGEPNKVLELSEFHQQLPKDLQTYLQISENECCIDLKMKKLFKAPHADMVKNWKNNTEIFSRLMKDIDQDAWSYLKDNTNLQQQVVELEKNKSLNQAQWEKLKQIEAIKNGFKQLMSKSKEAEGSEFQKACNVLHDKLVVAVEKREHLHNLGDAYITSLRELNEVIAAVSDQGKTREDKIKALNDYENNAKRSPVFGSFAAEMAKFLVAAVMMIIGAIVGTIVGGIPGTIAGAALAAAVGMGAVTSVAPELSIFKSTNQHLLDKVVKAGFESS
ncbi:hypothetical protein [Caedibacter taeniospiralis]|uniref:hypothetical protein n=1 Tax=Caedibacter taeniospiralis TaxID=28907 RepID=UPI000C26DCF0|nr:hypothetical protein [Caedibacter taeniospiralis]